MKKQSFAPVIDEKCKILILGTMPGDKSIKENKYYANSQNQFWRIMALVTNENFLINYDQKKDLLIHKRIAIWDVLMHCEREGSLDVNISDETPNDFISFFNEYPNINKVFFNGSKAEKLFKKFNLHDYSKKYQILPSTSSMNTSMNLEKKANIWKSKILESI